MKLSYSIKNWKGMDWAALTEAAVETGISGVEMYDVKSSVFEGKGSPTNPELASVTRRRLVNSGISVPSIDTYSDFTEFFGNIKTHIIS